MFNWIENWNKDTQNIDFIKQLKLKTELELQLLNLKFEK
jgi:hypothetical protein